MNEQKVWEELVGINSRLGRIEGQLKHELPCKDHEDRLRRQEQLRRWKVYIPLGGGAGIGVIILKLLEAIVK